MSQLDCRFDELKTRQRAERDAYGENLGLRVHRALSWLQRAELADDPDGQFIFLWVAFNAAYANEIDGEAGRTQQKAFGEFLRKLQGLDDKGLLDRLVWQEFPKSIRLLLDNRYVFASFWDWQKGKIDAATWEERFRKGKAAANAALANQDTATVLAIVLRRTYILRNQIIHGGATWNSQVNRRQVHDCVQLLCQLVPAVVEIMMNHSDTLWGDASYPVVKDV
ncbi:hypothetical protein LV476_04805 [Guyparkeria hydrothermalis]|uniref:HEPN domain-containing protein n=1 Tax=Guyparkeria hydrothermalis TaxID=923 RepID=UPI002021AB84|nr:HEPN domain-containing protein [Guyparkeria hydrothermalis]MCL7744271.1 hypothetical protein [Guyparkeria hydrothermalis]